MSSLSASITETRGFLLTCTKQNDQSPTETENFTEKDYTNLCKSP